MIEASITIVDRLIQLVTARERNKEKYFNNFVEPLYRDAEAIIKDYTSLFVELIAKLERSDEVPDVIKWIEERRMLYLPVRIKTRALLRELKFSGRKKESISRFEKGISGVMEGGLSLFDEGYIPTDYHSGHTMNHTVLDLLYLLNIDSSGQNRERYLIAAKEQLACIHRAWQDVAAGYADMRSVAFS